MSQPTLNSSFSGINFAGMNRGSRLSYTSLRAASGDNSINEEERLSAPSVQGFGGSSRGSLTMDHSSARLSQPDVRRFALRHDVPTKRERLSQPTLVSGDYHPGRGQQRLSQPCLSTGKEFILPTMVFHSPSPPTVKHKRFSPAIPVSKRERLSQLDIGSKYRNLKESTATKFNRDRFSIPELETQNDLKLIAGTPKQRFSLDSQLKNQDITRSRLLPIASSPISEHQQPKIDEQTTIPITKNRSPTREGLGSVLVASATPILPSSERQFLSIELNRKTSIASTTITTTTTTTSTTTTTTTTMTTKTTTRNVSQQKNQTTGKLERSVSPVPTRERMSVPEIRNSSLRRLLDPPTRQRHSITGNLRQSLISPIKPLDFGRKSPKHLFEEALERFRRDEKEENRKNEISNSRTIVDIVNDEPKHIQKHYSYTYESTDDNSSILGKVSVSVIPKKKYLESNFDENEQVITTVIETDVPMIMASPKYMKKSSYSSEAPKWIRKYLENESPKVARRAAGNKEKANRKNSRRKSSLESVDGEKVTKKVRSKSVSSGERSPKPRNTVLHSELKNMKNTYVRIVPSNKIQENRYEVKIENSWPDGDGIQRLFGDECEDTDSDDSTSI
ncbi:uncharacterized protein LOC143265215 [Megachile rotundata]|uniref:uncharacterized protein LOC143265215 n=1 Tax=Megachile rotundata TaxID=143995 RepID=UPI003FCF99FD